MFETTGIPTEALGYYLLLTLIVLMSFWESRSPRRSLDHPIRLRWTHNFALFFAGTFVLRLIVPVLSIEAARRATVQQWGLFSGLDVPLWLNIVVGIVLLDLVRYAMHWAAHRYELIWRMHRIHHSDREYDFTTALRVHPFEMFLGAAINVVVIVALGLHPLTVLLFEGFTLAANTFNHANVWIPTALDRKLRRCVVTPDMHRIHHSARPRELNANLGGFLPWWDHLFGTYVDQPRDGHEAMAIGLRDYKEEPGFVRILFDPFTAPVIGSELEPLASIPVAKRRQSGA